MTYYNITSFYIYESIHIISKEMNSCKSNSKLIVQSVYLIFRFRHLHIINIYTSSMVVFVLPQLTVDVTFHWFTVANEIKFHVWTSLNYKMEWRLTKATNKYDIFRAFHVKINHLNVIIMLRRYNQDIKGNDAAKIIITQGSFLSEAFKVPEDFSHIFERISFSCIFHVA